jgi:hypothetical protein
MLLANPSDVISQLGFDPMTDITFAVNMAMDAAEAYLAAQLNTDFESATYVDTFFVAEPPYRNRGAVRTEFRLSAGLVDSLTSVLTCYDVNDFGISAEATDVTANVILNADKGVVQDFKTHYVGTYVQITYSAGFAADPDNVGPPPSYLISTVPDWLQQACKIKTLIGLVDSPVLSEAQIKLDASMLGQQLVYLLSRKLRYAPAALLPL